MPSAHQRDPVSRDWWFFAEECGEKDARRYLELALRYQISFHEIFNMIGAALKEYNDLQKELDAMGEEITRGDVLLRNFELPIEEALAIWARSRDGLLRLAELFPEKREKIEANIAEQEEVLLAMVERYQRRAGAN